LTFFYFVYVTNQTDVGLNYAVECPLNGLGTVVVNQEIVF